MIKKFSSPFLGKLFVALSLIACLATTGTLVYTPTAYAQILPSPISPSTQAFVARQGLIDSILKQLPPLNAAAVAIYNERVNQWVSNKQQQKAGTVLPPIPVPPASWIVVPHVYSAIETAYEQMFPGLPKLIDVAPTGPPVCAQYVEPAGPPPVIPDTNVHVGSALRNGEYAAFPDDNMHAGYITRAPDGTVVRKVVMATPFGPAQWYAPVQ